MSSAAKPSPVEDVQGDGRWMSIHNRFVSETKEREPEVLFVGDSLVQNLAYTEVWEKMFEPLHCLNFGIGGDQTQHLLWRISNGELDGFSPKVWEKMFEPLHCLIFGIAKDETQHLLWRLLNGELDNINPKVIVVLIGTNNHQHTADEVVEGIQEIVKVINGKQPQAQIIVVGIPPRGQLHNRLREKIADINQSLAAELVQLPNCQFLNVDPGLFLSATDGSISHHDMFDYLHFTPAGYQKLCEPILDLIQDLMKTFVKVESV